MIPVMRSVRTERPRLPADAIALGLLLVAGVLVVWYLRGYLSRPLWFDEQWRAYHITARGLGFELRTMYAPAALGWLLHEKAAVSLLGSHEVALRAPMALVVVALPLATYWLARRWLGSVASALTAGTLLLNGAVLGYGLQLKPFITDALVVVVVLGIWTAVHGAARWRPVGYAAIGLLSLCSIAALFVLVPLLAVDLVAAVRARRLLPALALAAPAGRRRRLPGRAARELPPAAADRCGAAGRQQDQRAVPPRATNVAGGACGGGGGRRPDAGRPLAAAHRVRSGPVGGHRGCAGAPGDGVLGGALAVRVRAGHRVPRPPPVGGHGGRGRRRPGRAGRRRRAARHRPARDRGGDPPRARRGRRCRCPGHAELRAPGGHGAPAQRRPAGRHGSGQERRRTGRARHRQPRRPPRLRPARQGLGLLHGPLRWERRRVRAPTPHPARRHPLSGRRAPRGGPAVPGRPSGVDPGGGLHVVRDQPSGRSHAP